MRMTCATLRGFCKLILGAYCYYFYIVVCMYEDLITDLPSTGYSWRLWISTCMRAWSSQWPAQPCVDFVNSSWACASRARILGIWLHLCFHSCDEATRASTLKPSRVTNSIWVFQFFGSWRVLKSVEMKPCPASFTLLQQQDMPCPALPRSSCKEACHN